MKCSHCGKKLPDEGELNYGTTHYMPATLKNRYAALNGRLSYGTSKQVNLLMSEFSASRWGYKPPRPICADCFLKKLRRAVVALETALEGRKSLDPDEEPQETKPAETQQEPAEDRSFEDAVWAAFDK